MAGRISSHDPEHPAHQLAERFLTNVHGGLRELYERVPKAELERYLEVTVDNMIRSVTEYLRPVHRVEQFKATTGPGIHRGRSAAN